MIPFSFPKTSKLSTSVPSKPIIITILLIDFYYISTKSIYVEVAYCTPQGYIYNIHKYNYIHEYNEQLTKFRRKYVDLVNLKIQRLYFLTFVYLLGHLYYVIITKDKLEKCIILHHHSNKIEKYIIIHHHSNKIEKCIISHHHSNKIEKYIIILHHHSNKIEKCIILHHHSNSMTVTYAEAKANQSFPPYLITNCSGHYDKYKYKHNARDDENNLERPTPLVSRGLIW